MSKICEFDIDNFSFHETPLNQARCFLRQVQPLGQVADAAAVLPQSVEKLVGLPVDISRTRLVSFLARTQILPDEIGGALTGALSQTNGKHGPVRQATY